MAAVSAPQATTALTPPSSSHGTQNPWGYAGQGPQQNSSGHPKSRPDKDFPLSSDRGALISQTNGSSIAPQTHRPDISQRRTDTFTSSNSSKSNHPSDTTYLAPARITALNRKDSNISETGSAPDSLLDLYGSSNNRSGLSSMDLGDRAVNSDIYSNDEDPERSRWIHRDKLARIESQELQAAGIILPRARAPSKSSRRERSRDQMNNGYGQSEEAAQHQKRQRIGGEVTSEEAEEQQDMNWDLRTPEEAAEDRNAAYRNYGNGQKGMSRIPLSKTSPLPIPLDYIERDSPMQRTRSNGWSGEDEAISYPKPRNQSGSISKSVDEMVNTPTTKRVASDTSPVKKTTPGVRKNSAPAIRAASTTSKTSTSRPQTRSGQKDAAQRPPTRSGELGPNNSIKRPEGDPPWLATMYKPDPRLPPDQQLLPTVARRLQQEQWEKDGKFGNTYDKEFRPMNDDEYQQPELAQQNMEVPEQRPEEQTEWPLRMVKSPTLSIGRPGTAGNYSTIPKIQDVPQSPLVTKGLPATQPLRFQEPPEDTKTKKGGCGCCIVM